MRIQKYSISSISFILLFYIITVTAEGAVHKIMPLGDSITKGTTSGEPDEALQVSYRKALYDKLEAAGYEVNIVETFVGTQISGQSVPDFDPDHEGHSGWRADEIVDGRSGFPPDDKLDQWLIAEEPDIVLLHIGTNDVTAGIEDWNEVEDILVVIDDYELSSGKAVWVVLALIIERSCEPYIEPCAKSAETTAFNEDVRDFVFFPRQAGGDNIVLVDMQNDARINYNRWNMGGDMWDDVHPWRTGYAKMADLWFTGLMDILPQANAGPDQDATEGASVTLDGSSSTGTSITFSWTQTDGPNVTLLDPTDEKPNFTAPDINAPTVTLTFQLTVTDDLGTTSPPDTVVVTVVDSPFADAGPAQDVTEGATLVTLNGNASTGRNITFAWTPPAGVTLSNPTAPAPTFTAPIINTPTVTLTFQLTVTDDLGETSTDTVVVTVVDSPLANAGADQNVAEGATVILNGNASTGRNITFAWTPPTGVTLSNPTAPAPTFTAPIINTPTVTLTFQLTVTDDLGETSTDTVDVIVADGSSPPVANAGPDQDVTEGATVRLDGSRSTGTGITFSWTQTAGTRVQLTNATSATPTFPAPQVDVNGETLIFELTVNGGVH